MPTVNSSHPITFAVHYEQTIAQPPGYAAVTAPAGQAANWASDEGTNTDRLRVIEADPAFIRQSAIEDPRLQSRIFAKDTPIKGLRNSDGGSFSIGLTGSESVTTATNQVTETAFMRLLEHCWGGLLRGTATEVAAAPSSDVSYDVDAATGMDEGAIVFVADTDSAAKLYPQRILTLSGTSITTDQDLPFAIAENDVVHPAACIFIDQDALANPADAASSTVSVHIEKAGQSWDAVGCQIQVDSIEFPRNDVPRLNMSIFAAAGYAPGDLSVGEVTWTGSVTGAAGLGIGADTKVHLQDKGTTTTACLDVVSMTVTPGVPVVPYDTVTECDAGMQGRAGYGTKPEDCIIELQCFVDTGHQDDWDTTQARVIKIYQVGPAGSAWCVMAPEAYLLEPPTYSEANEAGMMTLRFICHEDDSLDATASDTNLSRSKLILALG
jgi:hypothetical protein